MKKLLKKYKVAGDICMISVLTLVMTGVLSIGLGIYSFVRYPNAYFTTSANYQRLEILAPGLWMAIMISFIVAIVALVVAYLSHTIGMSIKAEIKEEGRR